ncbi:nucleotide exchange factor GrpE [Candidatus Woesearchaeota archaeon]|nr:nucleotide exchange factor GrpE [Candidatus Woesearchaeota archaeon]
MTKKKSEKKEKKKQKISKQLEKKQQELEETTDLLKRVQADFENYQKRVEKEKEQFTQYASLGLVKELLPILDSFDLALKNSDNEDINALYDQIFQILSSKGLKKIDSLNEKFDPYLHEAVMQERSEKPNNTIIEEMQAGYKFKDRIIRPSKVKISKNDGNTKDNKKDDNS